MKKVLVVIMSILCIGVIILTGFKVYDQTAKATLVQLSTTNNDRMMGYILLTKDNKVIVVDGGNYEDGTKLEEYINKYGGVVDSWYITHYHKDHTGAFRYITENTNIKINNIYHSLPARENVESYEEDRLGDYDLYTRVINSYKEKENLHEVSLGMEIAVNNNIKVKVLGTKNEEITTNFGNNQSVVYKFYIGKTSILFLGDTGIESEEKLKKNFRNELRSDYVQMAHHGQAGVSEEMYKIIDPKVCLWPAPRWVYDNDKGEGFNTWILKTIETREWIQKLGAKSYVAYDSDIIIKIH